MPKDNTDSLSHTRWNCKYHIVFAPKFRRQAVYGKIKPSIGKILRTLCEQKKVEILEANVYCTPLRFVLKQNSFLARIPHDRLVQKIQIMFQDGRVADVVCALMGLNVLEADEHNKVKYFGIPKNTPLTDLLAYELYLHELDQTIAHLGLEFVRFNEEYIVFCDSYEHAKVAQTIVWAFARDTMGCPVNRNYSQIKDIAHLAFRGLRLWRGKWRIQEQLKENAEYNYTVGLAKYLLSVHASPETEYSDKKDAILWSAYRQLSRFISSFEGVDDVKDEVLSLKEKRDKDIMTFLKLGVGYMCALTAEAKVNKNAEQPEA